MPSRGIVTISFALGDMLWPMPKKTESPRGLLHLDVDPVAVLLRRGHLQLFDRFLRRPALLDLDDDVSPFARADLDRAVEGREVQVGRARHREALFVADDVPLRVDDDAGAAEGRPATTRRRSRVQISYAR